MSTPPRRRSVRPPAASCRALASPTHEAQPCAVNMTFTAPTVATVGLTDEQAAAQGIACECRVLPMSAVPRALVNRDTRGFVKIVAEAGTGRILGATVVADGAGDVIQAAVYAVQFGLTTDQVANTWAPYLTFAEGFKLAAQTFRRDVSKLSCCAA